VGQRVIFDGALRVGGDDYFHFVDDVGTEAEVEDLDVQVTLLPAVQFWLDYPFATELAGTVRAEGGITLRQVIDAIRAGYRTMYRGAAARDVAAHTIEDIYIERIVLDEETGDLDVVVGS
jgi:hypothetical protein